MVTLLRLAVRKLPRLRRERRARRPRPVVVAYGHQPPRPQSSPKPVAQAERFRKIAADRARYVGEWTDPRGQVQLVICTLSPARHSDDHSGQTAVLAFPPTWAAPGRDLKIRDGIRELRTAFPQVTDDHFREALARCELLLRCRTLCPM